MQSVGDDIVRKTIHSGASDNATKEDSVLQVVLVTASVIFTCVIVVLVIVLLTQDENDPWIAPRAGLGGCTACNGS